MFVDRWLRRGTDIQELIGDRKYLNWAGPIAMAVGMVLSIWLFANQVSTPACSWTRIRRWVI